MNKNKLLGGFCAVNMLVLPQIVVKAQQSTAVNDKKTNIIFILADDMGYCDLACYGNKYIETPILINWQQLALLLLSVMQDRE